MILVLKTDKPLDFARFQALKGNFGRCLFEHLVNWYMLFTLRDKSLRTLCTGKQVFSLKKCTIKKP